MALKKRRISAFWLLILASVALFGLQVIRWRSRGSQSITWEALVARVRTRGQPTTTAEVYERYPFNATAFERFQEFDRVCSENKGIGRRNGTNSENPPEAIIKCLANDSAPAGRIIGPEAMQDVLAWVQTNAATADRILASLYLAQDFGYPTRDALNKWTMPSHHIHAVALLMTQAALAIDQHDLQRGCFLATNALQLVQHNGHFDVIGTMLMYHEYQQFSAVMHQILRSRQFNEDQLQGLQQFFDNLIAAPGLHSRFRIGWANSQDAFLRESHQWTRWWTIRGPHRGVPAFLYAITGSKRGDLVETLALLDEQAETFQGSYLERQARRLQFESHFLANSNRWDRRFVGLAVSHFGQLPELELRTQSWLRAVATSIAIERFRLRHDHLPESLTDLAPEFVPKVFDDPFDGHPIRYRHELTGYVIYSVGMNGTDDAGQPLTQQPWNWNDTNALTGDVGIRVIFDSP